MIFTKNIALSDGRVFNTHEVSETSYDIPSEDYTIFINSWENEDRTGFPTRFFHRTTKPIEQINDELTEEQLLTFDWFLLGQSTAVVEKTFEELKAIKREEITNARLKANYDKFTLEDKEFNASQAAQNDLNGISNYISLYGELPPSFPGAWMALDESILYIPDVDSFKGLYSAFVAQGNANFTKMAILLAHVELATTPEELAEVIW